MRFAKILYFSEEIVMLTVLCVVTMLERHMEMESVNSTTCPIHAMLHVMTTIMSYPVLILVYDSYGI